MKISKTILRETAKLAVGLLIADALMCAVFVLLGYFDYTVVLGALWGTLGAVLNFFLLGVTVQKAADRESGQKKAVQASYSLRMLMLAAFGVVGILLPWFQTYAVIIPLVLTTPIMLLLQAIENRRQKQDERPDEGGQSE